eukprot:2975205-Rhodomonas_salina.2
MSFGTLVISLSMVCSSDVKLLVTLIGPTHWEVKPVQSTGETWLRDGLETSNEKTYGRPAAMSARTLKVIHVPRAPQPVFQLASPKGCDPPSLISPRVAFAPVKPEMVTVAGLLSATRNSTFDARVTVKVLDSAG